MTSGIHRISLFYRIRSGDSGNSVIFESCWSEVQNDRVENDKNAQQIDRFDCEWSDSEITFVRKTLSLEQYLQIEFWTWGNKLVKLLLSIESFESYDNQILEHAKDVLMKTDFVQNHENN